MKKTLVTLLVLGMVCTLASCGQKAPMNNTEQDQTTQTSPVEIAEGEAPSETEENIPTEDTTKPEDTAPPKDTSKPEETKPPKDTTKPEDTKPPKDTSKPEDTTPPKDTSKPEETKPSKDTTKPEDNKPPKDTTKPEDTTPPDDTTKPEDSTPEDSKTMGETLQAAFKDAMASNPSYSTTELASLLVSNDVIEFMGGSYEVTPGWLQGFDTEIEGFSSGTGFGPMIGSIAFVGYVFELDENADVAAFKQTLKDNANPRWQICVQAGEIIVDSVDNKVFFVMCPGNLDQ